MVAFAGDWLGTGEAVVLLAVLALATLGTLALFLVAVLAYRERRSGVYLLVTVAIGLLVVRSVVGIGTAMGLVPMPLHHLTEHGADVLVAALVLYALVRMGPVRART